MANIDCSYDTSVDSQEESTQDSIKLEFSEDEETLIARMFGLLGERWSLIAGRIPGRSAEEIEKYWTSKYSKLNEEMHFKASFEIFSSVCL